MTAVLPVLKRAMISDGSGGVYIAWEDARNADLDIYAQHISSDGIACGVENGAPVCTAPENQRFIEMTSYGEEGAYVTWHDFRDTPVDDVYVQRLDYYCEAVWDPMGISPTATDKYCDLVWWNWYKVLIADECADDG